jgi:hypothetical protein
MNWFVSIHVIFFKIRIYFLKCQKLKLFWLIFYPMIGMEMTNVRHFFTLIFSQCARNFPVLVSFSPQWQIPKRNKRKRDWFWFMVSEISVHSQMAPLLGAWGEASESIMTGARWGEGEEGCRGQDADISFRAHSQWLLPAIPSLVILSYPQ